jgi:hypothetical protein
MEENLVIFLPFYFEEGGGGTEFSYTSATHRNVNMARKPVKKNLD